MLVYKAYYFPIYNDSIIILDNLITLKTEKKSSEIKSLTYRIISPNLKSTVYCTSIREGGETEWNFAWKMHLETNSAGERDTILSALGCTEKTWILIR